MIFYSFITIQFSFKVQHLDKNQIIHFLDYKLFIKYKVEMPKWQINLNNTNYSSQVKQYEQLEQPFGFSTDTTVSHVELPRKKQMIEKKLWQMATSSKAQIFMTMVMFWMIGNGISIYTIFFIFQSLFSAVTALLRTSKVFEPFETMVSSTFKYKVIYCGINLILVGIVAYKLSSMGLLPVSAADYVDLVPKYEPIDVLSRAR